MTFSASVTSSSAPMVTGSADMIVLTRWVFGSVPPATPRMTMSRSVTMPTRRPPSTTGIEPQSSCFMSVATSPSVASGLTVVGCFVMSSRTFMCAPPGGDAAERTPRLSRRADLEDLGPADRADPLSRGAPVLHGDLLRVLYLTRGLALDAIACGQRSTSAGCLFPQRTLAPWLGSAKGIRPQNPVLSDGVRGEEGKGWDFLLSNTTGSKRHANPSQSNHDARSCR